MIITRLAAELNEVKDEICSSKRKIKQLNDQNRRLQKKKRHLEKANKQLVLKNQKFDKDIRKLKRANFRLRCGIHDQDHVICQKDSDPSSSSENEE
jgi:mRNA-degrading endonuclease RelE of RelBE toxin-antitoxin system